MTSGKQNINLSSSNVCMHTYVYIGSIAPEPLLQDDASAAASGNAETQAAHTTGTPEQSISPPALPKQLARECDPSPIQLQPAPITAPSPSAGSMRTIHHFPRILVTNPGPY